MRIKCGLDKMVNDKINLVFVRIAGDPKEDSPTINLCTTLRLQNTFRIVKDPGREHCFDNQQGDVLHSSGSTEPASVCFLSLLVSPVPLYRGIVPRQYPRFHFII